MFPIASWCGFNLLNHLGGVILNTMITAGGRFNGAQAAAGSLAPAQYGGDGRRGSRGSTSWSCCRRFVVSKPS